MPTVYSPPVSTYVALATETLSGTDTSVTFSSIPATYRDLVVVAKTFSASATGVGVRFNGDTGSNYSMVYASGNGSTATSSAYTSDRAEPYISGATDHLILMQIMDYSATDKHKTMLSRGESASGKVQMFAIRWADTSAINSIEIFTPINSYGAGTTLSLYGIEA